MSGVPAEILFCFSRPIDEFRISFSRVMAGEILRGFSAGPPSAVEGDLIHLGDLRYSVPPAVGDGGQGTLTWRGVNSSVFSFVIDNRAGWATAVDGFALSAPPPEDNQPATSSAQDTSPAGACDRLRIGF